MLVLLLSLAALARGQHLPVPQLRPLEAGGAEFSIQDVPGASNVVFSYHGARGEEVKGQAYLGNDGVWRHQTIDLPLEHEVVYGVKVNMENGEQRGAETVFVPQHKVVLPPGGRRTRGAVIFRDDFNFLDTSKWQHEVSMYGGMNWEFQVYTPESANSFVRGGNLYLKPTYTVDHKDFDQYKLTHGIMDMQQMYGRCTQGAAYGCHREGQNGYLPAVMSAKLKSVPTIKFGTVEVRAKIPKGDWIWPAIWMLSRSNRYGNWPRSGEIDIMESRGNTAASSGGNNHGVSEVSSTLHWGPAWNQNRYGMTHGEKHGADWSGGFHTYKLDWSPNHIIISVDNQQVLNVPRPGGGFWQKGHFSGGNIWSSGTDMAPFDQDFYLILNVAVGGTNGFFPDGWQYNSRKPWNNGSPHANQDFWDNRGWWQNSWRGDDTAMQIDYVEFRHL